MLQCFLTQRFPFFASEDDTEALLELTNIFGVEEMTICAARHGKTTLRCALEPKTNHQGAY